MYRHPMRWITVPALLLLGACGFGGPETCLSLDEATVRPGEGVLIRGVTLGPPYGCPDLEPATALRVGNAVSIETPRDTLQLSFSVEGGLNDASYRRETTPVYVIDSATGRLDLDSGAGQFDVVASEYGALFPVKLRVRGRFVLPASVP